jgi:hypothetical protein
LPRRLDRSDSFEHGIESLVRIHLEELRHACSETPAVVALA